MELKIIDKRPEVKTVAVITPTVNSDHFTQCYKSVRNQTYKNIKHYVVVDTDGPGEITAGINQKLLQASIQDSLKLCMLPENVGANGWYGHRVYAAFSFLVNADAVCFLDEDNWFEPNHIEALVDTINTHDCDWSFSFRKIYDKEGNYLVHDNCESLGIHPAWHNDKVFHVDTSSYMVRQDVAVRAAGGWYGQWGADRQYFSVLAQHFPNARPSGQHSLCYRLDGNPNSVSKEFFEKGNEAMKEKYDGKNFPWLTMS
jgi:glycosyltransferase involved in cell wall biosynthesis